MDGLTISLVIVIAISFAIIIDAIYTIRKLHTENRDITNDRDEWRSLYRFQNETHLLVLLNDLLAMLDNERNDLDNV